MNLYQVDINTEIDAISVLVNQGRRIKIIRIKTATFQIVRH